MLASRTRSPELIVAVTKLFKVVLATIAALRRATSVVVAEPALTEQLA